MPPFRLSSDLHHSASRGISATRTTWFDRNPKHVNTRLFAGGARHPRRRYSNSVSRVALSWSPTSTFAEQGSAMPPPPPFEICTTSPTPRSRLNMSVWFLSEGNKVARVCTSPVPFFIVSTYNTTHANAHLLNITHANTTPSHLERPSMKTPIITGFLIKPR